MSRAVLEYSGSEAVLAYAATGTRAVITMGDEADALPPAPEAGGEPLLSQPGDVLLSQTGETLEAQPDDN